ncbi:MAG: IS1634 family transposase [Burkholderiales bacterium]|nr:IS1634 family transposase [Burkholderiales bacterium]NIQ20257.1 IS1634 family transposase [Gammaproteobacteria bacterium]
MKIELKGQAKEKLGESELVVITERVDDVALLIAQMIKMGLPEVLDRYIPRHWKQRGLSWGWTSVIWLAYILTEGDHRKVSVEAYIKGMKHTLSQLTAQVIEPLDFSDDRLSHLLKYLSKPTYWHKIEEDLNERSIEVYDLAQEVIRCDATTVSGDHEVSDDGLFQFGHSKDDPSRPQIKIMIGSLDPLGMPLATAVLSGERADDGLYLPIIDRIRSGLRKSGLLFVGDCKMSALETRWHLARHQQLYLSPLPLTGSTVEAMAGWIAQGMAKAKGGELEAIWRSNDRGEVVLAAEAYEVERSCHEPQGERQWTERVLVVRSPAHAAKQAAGLASRLENAQGKLAALTPSRGRGKRQITAEATLLEAIASVLKAHRVEGLLDVQWEKQTERKTQYVGRGRGSAKRDQRVIEKSRYQITRIVRHEEAIAALKGQFGWKAFVTNAEPERLSLKDAVLCYRNEYRVERIFNRLKSRVHIAPMFVTLNEQIEGLTHLLTLGVRVLTVMEFVVRQSLQRDHAKLPGLHPENKQKGTDKPTAERLLKAFSKVSLTLIQTTAGEAILRQVTPLSAVQEEILKRLGLSPSLYRQLEIQET